ncbi:MAG: Dinitrogenase iron-molybdenum cofactor [bacterium ADurb.Bin157]|nr:MAG: Dinitrogenase iron-molybdenum cofactor [bacterium ADurb.Bin157]
MKIAIPVDSNNENTDVCVSFGRAPYFLIHDTESKKNVFILNEAANAQGGAGIKAAQTVADSKAEVLLTPRCGENAAEVINTANIKVYKSEKGAAKSNIEAFEKGKLSELKEIQPGMHGNNAG